MRIRTVLGKNSVMVSWPFFRNCELINFLKIPIVKLQPLRIEKSKMQTRSSHVGQEQQHERREVSHQDADPSEKRGEFEQRNNSFLLHVNFLTPEMRTKKVSHHFQVQLYKMVNLAELLSSTVLQHIRSIACLVRTLRMQSYVHEQLVNCALSLRHPCSNRT